MRRNLKLVYFDKTFLEHSFRWLNDPFIQCSIDSEPVSKEKQQNWFNTLQTRSDYKLWGLTCDDFPIGVVGLRHVTTEDAEFFCYVGEKEYWGGCGRPIMKLAEEKAVSLGIKSIWLRVLYNNFRAKTLYDHIGYSEFSKDGKFYFMRKKITE